MISHERGAVDDALDAGQVVAHGGVEDLAHRHHDGGADERAPQRARPADQADHQGLRDHEHAEDRLRRDDEEDRVDVDGAGDGGRRRAQHVRGHLAAEGVHAHRLGRLLVLLIARSE